MYKGKTLFTIFSIITLLAVVFVALFFVSKNTFDTKEQISKIDVEEIVFDKEDKEADVVSLSDEDLVEMEEEKLPFLSGRITGGTSYTPEDADLVDVFIINGNSLAALSTSTGDRFYPFEGNNNTVVFNKIFTEYKKGDYLTYDFSVNKLREYNHSVTIVVLGLADGHYTFSGIVLNEKNEPRDFLYTLMTQKGYKHEFEFDFDTGETRVSQSDYSDLYNRADYEELVSDECDVADLEQQLTSFLKVNGLNFDMKERVSGKIERQESDDWIPIFDDACMLTVSFLEEEVEDLGGLIGVMWNKFDDFEVNGHLFSTGLADGPTGSTIAARIKVDDNHVQQVVMSRIGRAIPINYPEMVVCPCYSEYTFSITEPVYVELKE